MAVKPKLIWAPEGLMRVFWKSRTGVWISGAPPPLHKKRDIIDLSLQLFNVAGQGSIHPPLQHHPGST